MYRDMKFPFPPRPLPPAPSPIPPQSQVGRAWGNRGNAHSRQVKLQTPSPRMHLHLTPPHPVLQMRRWAVHRATAVTPALVRASSKLSAATDTSCAFPSPLFSNTQVGRAWGNRGNARSRQGKLQEALADYNQAIIICPWSPDPVLNRGVVLEALGR